MNTNNTPATPPSYPLLMLAPRESWPTLIELAAAILEGRSDADREAVATELRLIAGAMGVQS